MIFRRKVMKTTKTMLTVIGLVICLVAVPAYAAEETLVVLPMLSKLGMTFLLVGFVLIIFFANKKGKPGK